MSGGHLFVISGASGVGKSTILKQVMAMRPQLQFSVSATSRAPREGETDGVQYFFVSEDAFREMIDQGAFVEYDYHMGNFYGTLKSEIIKKTKQGGLVSRDGKIYQNNSGELVEVEADEKTAKRITGMLQIRDLAQNLLNAQMQGQTEKSIADARKALNKAYDAFVKENGYLNSPANKHPSQSHRC